MNKTRVNPWTWQERFGFSHAWRVDGASSIVFLSGQGPIAPDGQVVAAGDFEAQARMTFENLQTVLEQANASWESVVKLTTYLTDVTNLRTYARVRDEFIRGAAPASTLVGVSALALPGMMLEVEGVAVL